MHEHAVATVTEKEGDRLMSGFQRPCGSVTKRLTFCPAFVQCGGGLAATVDFLVRREAEYGIDAACELSEPRLMKLNGGTLTCVVVVAPATGLCQQASVGIFQHQAPGVILDEQVAVSGGVQVPLSVFSAFQKERPSAGFPMSMGSSASSFGTMGEVSIRMREGTFADRFDGERQLWIVVVGRLREVQRLEGWCR